MNNKIVLSILGLFLIIGFYRFYFLLWLPIYIILLTWPLLAISPLGIFWFNRIVKRNKLSLNKITHEFLLAIWLKVLFNDIYYLLLFLFFKNDFFTEMFRSDMWSFHLIGLGVIWILSRLWNFVLEKTYVSFKGKTIYRWLWLIYLLIILSGFVYYQFIQPISSID